MKIILAYVPVIHQGYLDFFNKYDGDIYLLDRDLTQDLRPLQKDIRALLPTEIKTALLAYFPGRKVEVINSENLQKLAHDHKIDKIIMPDEIVSHQVADDFFAGLEIEWVSVFLRWDRDKSLNDQKIESHEKITKDKFAQQMMDLAHQQKVKSADWWRQVGAVLIKDQKVLSQAYNRHLPGEQQPYIDGDTRADYHKGEHIEMTTAIHAESQIIAECAKKGLATAGASLYVTTFPCPVCAKLVAVAGIKKLYFSEGYAMLDGQTVLEKSGVEIIRVI